MKSKCKMCQKIIDVADQRAHLSAHAPAAESAIEDPSEFFEKLDDLEQLLGAAREAQGHFWSALRALEDELGEVRDDLDAENLEEVTVEDLLNWNKDAKPMRPLAVVHILIYAHRHGLDLRAFSNHEKAERAAREIMELSAPEFSLLHIDRQREDWHELTNGEENIEIEELTIDSEGYRARR